MAIPAIKMLKEAKLAVSIDALFMNKVAYDAYQDSGLFDNCYYIDFFNTPKIKLLKEVYKIRRNRYHKSILIYPSNDLRYNAMHFIFGAKKRYAHDYLKKNRIGLYFLNNQRVKQSGTKHNTEENYELIKEAFGIAIKKEKMFFPKEYNLTSFAEAKIAELGWEKETIIGVHAGCDILKNQINRRWDFRKFRELIIKIAEEQGFKFLLFGGRVERDINAEISKGLADILYEVKDTTFRESVSLIRKCKYFISNDSGLMHTASALNIPQLAIIGPTNQDYIYPYNGNFIIAAKKLACMPCFEYSSEPLKCSKENKFECIRSLEVEEVHNFFIKLINKPN